MDFSVTIFQFPLNFSFMCDRFFKMSIIFPDTVLIWRVEVWVELQGECDLRIGSLMRLAPLTEFCHYGAERVLT